MKTLKLGRLQNGYAVEVECTGKGNGNGGCGSLLLVEADDMRYYPGVSGDSWGSREAEVMFRCQECGVLTDLDRRKWPPAATTKLKKSSQTWRDGKDDGLADEA